MQREGSLLFPFSINTPGYVQDWQKGNDNVELHPVVMRFHKEEVAHVGTESVYVKHCSSTRCAFAKAGTEHGVTNDLMYVYEPMGLDRQAYQMGSLLARFQSRNMAACFLEALDSKLGMKIMDVRVNHETSCCMCLCMYEFTHTWDLCIFMYIPTKVTFEVSLWRRAWNLQLQTIFQRRLHENTRRHVKTCSPNGLSYSVHMRLGNASLRLIRILHRRQEFAAIGTACPSWSRKSA